MEIKGENTWTQSMEYKFDNRIKFMIEMAELAGPFKSVMDLGCGNQAAKKYLPSSVEYIPVNYMHQAPNTIIRDFNLGEFYEREADLMLCSGILEYIYEPLPFLRNISKYCLSSAGVGGHIVLSYVLDEYRKENAKIWVNSMTRDELLVIFDNVGFTIVREKWYIPNHQKVFLLKNNVLNQPSDSTNLIPLNGISKLFRST
ncbi:MAG: class I SAM-dependent methyltransferase [Chitinispirillales bacterium]|jgi:hypothetical protein|nr:class I SAM-dependent methyltransferase [Chitinispirillales bacterium]